MSNVREVTMFMTCDGKAFHTEREAQAHAKLMLENRIGELIDFLCHDTNMGPKQRLKMLENAMQAQDVLFNHCDTIRDTLDWE